MNPRMLEYYNQELQHIRESAAEFAQEFPKIASRLTLSGIDCADPYVERLLEGFAYLSARVHLKLDAEYPTFTHNLLEIAYPHYLAPTPSMVVVQLVADPDEGSLTSGFTVERNAALRGQLGHGEQTACEYRSAHAVTLWPLQVSRAEYFGNPAATLGRLAASEPRAKAGLRLRLRCGAGLAFNALALDNLPLYLNGADEQPFRLYEHLLGNACALFIKSVDSTWVERLPLECLKPRGFDDQDAVLPVVPRAFQGYRLLQEYFALPQRFLPVEAFTCLDNLADCFERAAARGNDRLGRGERCSGRVLDSEPVSGLQNIDRQSVRPRNDQTWSIRVRLGGESQFHLGHIPQR